jgi:colicin import membrane protein
MSATIARPYEAPRGSGSGRAIVLAVIVHALLGALLIFGVHWQSSPPAVIQAELWSATPQTAAPAPRPVPPPPKVEAPVPETKVEPEPPPPKADIVEKTPPKVQPKKPPPVPKAETKPKPEPVRQPPKEAPVRAPSDLANILASANGPATSTGKDQQTSGPRGNETYIGRLIAAIRPQMRYPASSPGNPVVTMRIEQLPNGEVTNVTVLKPSGVQAFDEAVERAIRTASPLPRNEQGRVEPALKLDYKMYDEKN